MVGSGSAAVLESLDSCSRSPVAPSRSAVAAGWIAPATSNGTGPSKPWRTDQSPRAGNQSSVRAGRPCLEAKTAAWVRRSMPSLASRRET